MLYIVSIVFLVSLRITLGQPQCETGYWGDNCINYCGYCSEESDDGGVNASSTGNRSQFDRNCSSTDGTCPSGCQSGWSGVRCDEAICTGGCGPGECLTPNFCGNCGSKSRVSPYCEDIRLRGLAGAAISLAILTISLILLRIGSDTALSLTIS